MATAAARVHQPSFDELGAPLHTVTFVVVDLETTGGSPRDDRVTEVGAVKIRGGEVVGEFATLVDPGVPIPVSISALTGITASMVADRPPFEAVLPALVEFCRGAVLVAHNAGFDTGFLNAGLTRLDYPRLDHPVVCTAALARRLVRDEVRNVRLATLAQHFRCATQPTHRALADARATVEVFHGLLERAGSFGVTTMEDLVTFAKVRNTPLFRARRGLADGLPHAPGVYAFRSASGEILYVGKATDLRDRVRAYFGADDRRKIVDLLKEAGAVDHWVCPTPIEAAVREVRLIHAHRPRFNRRSKTPERTVWVKLTAERFPRLSIVRAVRDDGGTYLGPLPRRTADLVAESLQEATPLRRCTDRISARTRFPACALAELGRCAAPCEGAVDAETYAAAIAPARAAMAGCPGQVTATLHARMRALSDAGRFEDAARTRDRLAALVAAVAGARLAAWTTAAPLLVASRPAGRGAGQREIVVARHGRLVASTRCRDADTTATAAALRDEHAASGMSTPVGREEAEEVALLGAWLGGPDVRMEHCTGAVAEPVAGGAVIARLRAQLAAARRTTGRADAELAAKRTRRVPVGSPE
jgi:DNA polymerase III subunit epsilon